MATVLLIEDDRLSHRLVDKIYTSAGHEVLLAESTRGGWELLRTRMLVDLVVLDSQLGADWGWTFLQEVRRRPFFHDLPVVVYTAHTERDDVMHYVRLGVQAVHVKPFKAEVLLNELDKTLKTGRLARWLMPTDVVCARLKLVPSEYAGLLNSAIAMLEEDRKVVMRFLTSPNDGRLWSALSRMKQRLPELGVRVIEELVTLAEEQLKQDEITGAVEALGAIDALAAVLRQRALALLQMGGSVVNTTANGPPNDRPPPASGSQPPLAVSPAKPAAAGAMSAMARKIVAQPIWAYGELFCGLRQSVHVGAGPLQAALETLHGRPHLVQFLGVLASLDSIPETNFQDAAQRLRDVHGFEDACQRILLRAGMTTKAQSGRLDWLAMATRLGVPKTVLYAALGSLARQPLGGLIDLGPFRQRQLVTMLLAFETGRLLKLPYYHRLAAAGLARDVGLWLAALASPASTALILAMVAAGGDLLEMEQAVWGMTHRDLGARFLAQEKAAALYQEASLGRLPPAAERSVEGEVMLTVLRLVDDLAALSEADNVAQATKIREWLRAQDYPVWKALRKNGVTLPVDLDEFIELLSTLTGSATWIAHEAAS
jgi:DNA-binding response OmpR family regulator